jgi:1,4-alpha-glucan branching enzyme
MKQVLFLIFSAIGFCGFAQVVTTEPAVPSAAAPVTITFDVTGTDFASKNLDDVWLWAWLDNASNDINAPTNVNPATAAQDAAKVTRSPSNPNLYSITITATTFFNQPASQIQTVGVLLKGRDWSNGQTADKFITFSETFAIAFESPVSKLFFVDESESIPITVSSNEDAAIALKIGSDVIASSTGTVSEFSYAHSVTESEGSVTIVAEANNGSETRTTSFTYVIRTPTVSEPRPSAIVDGINYSGDFSKVTLSLWAPGKISVYVLGDFNGWEINPDFQMKKDGEHFWLEVAELTSGEEYAFQYLVDETLKIADPYADKILDPDDQYIPASTYPDLKPFPADALSSEWYFNRVAVLQTNQTPFPWAVTDFQKPPKEKLVIYELLIRDFFGSNERNYQNLIDTLGYLKRLGVNAIELMPIMEFNGNESWGYNPAFMFAPDKYYGTKNDLKEFIDQCHQNGLAVILDIAMNHQDMPNPYVMLDFDFASGKPQPDNRWFNVNATHPFSVFFDMNHESSYAKKYLDTVNYYWLNEFKVDGFRFDLSKGFTQTNNPNNVDAWSGYDASRIAILKRMADEIWEHSPEAYVILEHLSVNTEEKELAEYRAAEGKGMMLWGKMTEQYNQLTMGYEENTDISGVHHQNRDWNYPHLVSYMESHDEERLMVKNMFYGKVGSDYSVKDTLTSLSRLRAASTLFYTIPGPKMLWQFGELGYDFSINHCQDGSINESCRVSPKPVQWEYRDNSHRYWLYDHVRDLLRLRATYDVFSEGSVAISEGNSLIRQIVLKNNPYTASPANTGEMNAVVIANFDVIENVVPVNFPHTGTWYDYYTASTALDVQGVTSITLPPGGYKIFTDVAIESTVITGTTESRKITISLYPNPASDQLIIHSDNGLVLEVLCFTNYGVPVQMKRINDNAWDVRHLPSGLFISEVRTTSGVYRIKFIKR